MRTETCHWYDRQKEICWVTEKVFLSLLHNISNGGSNAVFRSGSCVSPESNSAVTVSNLSPTNPLYNKVTLFKTKLSCVRTRQAFLQRYIFCTILSESAESESYAMLNIEMYKKKKKTKPDRVCIFSLNLLPTAGEKVLHNRRKTPFKIVYHQTIKMIWKVISELLEWSWKSASTCKNISLSRQMNHQQATSSGLPVGWDYCLP